MANLAANPSLWVDNSGNTPPSWWNGSKYLFDFSEPNPLTQVMQLLSAPNSGDTFTVTFQNFATPDPGITTATVSLETGSGTVLTSWDLTVLNGPTATSYTFNGTEGLVQLVLSNIGTPNIGLYDGDFSFTPPGLPPGTVVTCPGPKYTGNVVAYIVQPTGSSAVLVLP
jgi:hypothetical protein